MKNLIDGNLYTVSNSGYKSFDVRLISKDEGEVELLSNIKRADGSGTMYVEGDFIYLPLGKWEFKNK